MKDSGYTLAETLVALTIVGFSISSLLLAMRVLSQRESAAILRVSQEQALQAFDRALGDTLDLGPLITGDPRRLRVACSPRDCIVDLDLSATGTKAIFDRPDGHFERELISTSVLFTFANDGRLSPSWARLEDRDRLTGPPIVIVRDGAQNLVSERTISPVVPDCTLDPISRHCSPATH